MSTSTTWRPSSSIGVSIASRVVPARSSTITRSWPSSRFTSDDLPTFGRPISASRTGVSSSSSDSRLRQPLGDQVEQVAGAEALRGRHGQRIAEAEPVELGRHPGLPEVVDLVGHHQHRQRAAAQLRGQLGVAGPQPGARVHHQHAQVGVGERGARLVAHRLRQDVVVGDVHAAGVDERELHAVPVGVDLLAVARDARPARAPPPRGWRRAG